MTSKPDQLSALTRLFSAAVFHDLANKGHSALFQRLVAQADLARQCEAHATVGAAFDAAFAFLKTAGYRDQYVYRAALTHKILMGTHSLRTATMLSEFRIGACKADLVILNGAATAYEIKSERDSLARLANQIANYRRVFAAVSVIAGENHIAAVLAATPDDVGVICLSRRYHISTVRAAASQPQRVCPQSIFESLRSAEAAAILKTMGAHVPDVPNTQLHAVMRALFAELKPADAHAQMVRVLQRTRNLSTLSELIDQLPQSLHAAALSIPLRRADHNRLLRAVATPLSAATAWV